MERKPYPPSLAIAESLGQPANPACHCANPMAAMLCMEGHLLECHVGMSCMEAQCSHLARYDEYPSEDL
jgi:hypothetical protein